MDTKKVSLNASAITWRLALIAALLVATNMGLQAYRLFAHHEHVFGMRLMSLDLEYNLPSLFSTVLLLSASVLLTLIAMLESKRKAPDTTKWMILAAGFLLMALDETMSLHEKMIEPLRNLLGGQHHHVGIFYFAWVIPGIALVVVLGAFFLPFLFRLPRRTAIAFAISGAIYVGGALGVELVEGWWREGHGHRNLTYHLLVSLEEGMEMFGVIAFIHALMGYIARKYGEVRLGFDNIAAIAAGELVPEMQNDQASSPLGASMPGATLLRD
ncbi:MAG: hypothetical protein ACMG5Z_02025 [Luteimonas sp.]